MISLAAAFLFLQTEVPEQPSMEPVEPSICGEIESDIEPDMLRGEADFNEKSYQWAMNYFRNLPDDMHENIMRAKMYPDNELYEDPFWGERFLAYNNALVNIEGYVLKLKALAAADDNPEPKAAFCEFLAGAFVYD